MAGKATPLPAAPSATSQASEAERTWAWMKNTTDQSMLENFIEKYRDTRYGAEARARIEELRKQQVAIAAPPSPAPLAPAAKEPLLPALIDKTLNVVLPKNEPKSDHQCNGVETTVGNEGKCLRPKDSFKDCLECPEMIVLPAGTFAMGSDEYEHGKPIHLVTIRTPFATAKFEVTFAEWDACVSAGGCKHRPEDRWGRGQLPVVNVSWNDVINEYLPWLNRRTAKFYRLLTEAEWEYAARAGTTTAYSFGKDVGGNQANCNACGSKWDNKQTAPVGSFAANAFGLHDMHGNTWEWVQDCFTPDYVGASNSGAAPGDTPSCLRGLRGASWLNAPKDLRSASRFGSAPDSRTVSYGFRVARALE